jgi:hypothetical protein
VKIQLSAFCLGLLLLGAALADSLNVRLIGSCPTPSVAFGLAVAGEYAYIAGGYDGLRIISIAAPAHPVEVGHYNTPRSASDVAVGGGDAYVADGEERVRVV